MPNDTAPAWPDPARPGVPMEPDWDGWHWLQWDSDAPEAYRWVNGHWSAGGDGAPLVYQPYWRYLGPCLTPSEHHQRTLAASAAAWIAARDAAAEAAMDVRTITPVGYDPSEDEDPELIDGPAQDAIHDAICALPPPSDAMAALAEVVRVAVEKEREACIAIANERGAWASNDADAESLVDRLEANGRMDMAKEIAAAIRARSTEGGA